MTPLVLLGVLLLVAVGAYLHWRAEQARRLELQQIADRLGFRFAPGDDPDHDDRYAQFEIFRRGHSRVAKNTMTGTLQLLDHPCRVCCGDFRYRVTRQHGKSRSTSTYRFSYLIVHLPWRTPPLLVRPEGIFDKLAGAFGFDDIDFESVEFSRRFHVKSDDKRFAYDVLHPRAMEFLLARRPPMLDLEDGALCLGDGARRWTPGQFEEQLEFVRAFFALWPRHLAADLEGASWRS